MEEAAAWLNEIQSGKGIDRAEFPDDMKGRIAKKYWDDPMFTYGLEYGALIVLHKITKEK